MVRMTRPLLLSSPAKARPERSLAVAAREHDLVAMLRAAAQPALLGMSRRSGVRCGWHGRCLAARMAFLRDLPARPRAAAPTPRYPARHLLVGVVAAVAGAAACTPASFNGDIAEPFGGAAPTSTVTGGAGGAGGSLIGSGGAVTTSSASGGAGGAGGATTSSSSGPRWDGGTEADAGTGGADGG
jgi:hypothetical protein